MFNYKYLIENGGGGQPSSLDQNFALSENVSLSGPLFHISVCSHLLELKLHTSKGSSPGTLRTFPERYNNFQVP